MIWTYVGPGKHVRITHARTRASTSIIAHGAISVMYIQITSLRFTSLFTHMHAHTRDDEDEDEDEDVTLLRPCRGDGGVTTAITTPLLSSPCLAPPPPPP